MQTTVQACSCEHIYQDKVYGKNKRVHNIKTKPEKSCTCRCTVCGDVRNYKKEEKIE